MPVQHDQQPILPGRITVMSNQDKTNVMKRLVNLNTRNVFCMTCHCTPESQAPTIQYYAVTTPVILVENRSSNNELFSIDR